MITLYAPVRINVAEGAAKALGAHQLNDAARFAFKAIAAAGAGMEVSYLRFTFDRTALAVRSRFARSGVMEIDLGLAEARQSQTAAPRRTSGGVDKGVWSVK